MYDDLRNQVLMLTPQDVPPVAGSSLIAMLMETGYPEAVATLVGVADGSTSLYFSNGGGIIGAGEDPEVAAATREWLAAGANSLELLPTLEQPPLVPDVDRTQFIAVTRHGLRGASAREQELGDGEHVLSPLFYAAQDVITQIRLLDESAGG